MAAGEAFYRRGGGIFAGWRKDKNKAAFFRMRVVVSCQGEESGMVAEELSSGEAIFLECMDTLRLAEAASVLCGKYSSTLRQVQFRIPQGRCLHTRVHGDRKLALCLIPASSGSNDSDTTNAAPVRGWTDRAKRPAKGHGCARKAKATGTKRRIPVRHMPWTTASGAWP